MREVPENPGDLGEQPENLQILPGPGTLLVVRVPCDLDPASPWNCSGCGDPIRLPPWASSGYYDTVCRTCYATPPYPTLENARYVLRTPEGLKAVYTIRPCPEYL